MKFRVASLRAVVLVCTSLALTACGGPMTEEAVAVERAALESCGNWSSWYWDGSSITCSARLGCGTYCDEYGVCDVNPAALKREYSYRVCFDEAGNYTHTEYQYRNGNVLHCGC